MESEHVEIPRSELGGAMCFFFLSLRDVMTDVALRFFDSPPGQGRIVDIYLPRSLALRCIEAFREHVFSSIHHSLRPVPSPSTLFSPTTSINP